MGQLALLRGMAGAPVRSKSYARTKIETGRVGRDHGLSGLQRRRFPTVSRKHRAQTLELIVRCNQCHNQWTISAQSPPIVLKAKEDRRGPR